MYFYKIELSYLGTHYHGWQVQPGAISTVQGDLLKALEVVTQCKNIKTIGSGRTDAGVHALGQIVRVEIEKNIDPQVLFKACNSLLKSDISLTSVERCEESFHPIFSAQKKKYEYLFSLGKGSCPPHLKSLMVENRLDFDLELARRVCESFVGEHDFKNFMTVGTPVKSTRRIIYSCELEFIKPDLFWSQCYQGHWVLRVEGNGFLKQMVRLMVGAIFNSACAGISFEEFCNILNGDISQRAGPVAPAHGLYLVNVTY